MKALNKLIICILVCSVIIISCQKATDPGSNLMSSGTLSKDASGNCTPITVNGIYKASTGLGVANYMDVTVNVNSPGSYEIASNEVNGIHFGDSADFTAAGQQIVRLKGYGIPLSAGLFSFSVKYNNASSCNVGITVSPAGASATAVFTLAGAPGSCTAPVIQGTYLAGTGLNASNKLIIGINVTAAGDYNLSTAVVNGISFSGTGTLNTTGAQTVSLSGTGTPLIAGTNQMSVSGAAAGCSFPLTVGGLPGGDTVALVKKLEVLTSLYPGYGIVPYRTYHFYYDGMKRVSAVGIKIYPLFVTDTFTTRLEYSGNNMRPGRIIMPYLNGFQALSYDTTWFSYGQDGKLEKDSTYELFYGGPVRKPLYRIYTYPDATSAKIDWYWAPSVSANPVLLRRDTVRVNANGRLDSIKAVYVTDPATGTGSYAKAHSFTYSQVINPLSKLNISGTPYSLIYTDVKKELLGNTTHPVVYNSNGSATYLDFVSPVLPGLFYIAGYNSLGQIMGQGGVSFTVEITPWSVRPDYPSEIKVAMSTSLVGDKYIYRYTY